LADEIRRGLEATGATPGGRGYDDALRSAFFDWVGMENLEERWSDEAKIERQVLEHLRARA
ncbi:MAG: hypothetical protein M3161_02540, partial [Actinomycetota bacterium]|nr:hypothetical protein [Actinomycetota bacterium]